MNDFKREYEALREALLPKIDACLANGYYILGGEVAAFEHEFAAFVGTKYCVGVANGMEAIEIVLRALNIGEGDEVITVSNSAVATALAITRTGATPVFADLDEYFHMDPASVEKVITPKTKAMLPVHIFGQSADIDGLMQLCKKHDLFLVEDACQAHGTKMNGRHVGSFGDAGAFSFYPTKNLGSYGDGGAITTDNKELADTCRMLRNYGQETRYHHKLKGLNSRLDELQAVILRDKLGHLNDFVSKRQHVAALYRKNLTGIPEVTLPMEREGGTNSYHLFVIRVSKRDELQAYMKDHGVESLVHYPIPIHKQECYKELNSLTLPVTEAYAKDVLSIPIHPFLTDEEVKTVSATIRAFYTHK
ncbi:MAG TPA: DegT/DnrJ/EryC1/StrS family aminotransferase [Patescibacteria group bacterium]|nr:DegT/DnrJ/EryC1/StrS family aminotransferase [Patescibacteria group bacterium]